MSTLAVCVFCGSRAGNNPAFEFAARAMGKVIGHRGGSLVYGGGRAGLMGVLADAALAAGARVVGVIPQSLMHHELGHSGLTELHIVNTMHDRKRLMAERSDAFVALPGGIGTMEELFEVWSWRQLGYHDKPLGLLNVAGYYDAMLEFMAQTVGQGFVSDGQHQLLQVSVEPEELLDRLNDLARSTNAPDNYQQI